MGEVVPNSAMSSLHTLYIYIYIFTLVILRIVPGSIKPAVYVTFRWSNPAILFVFPDFAQVFIAL